jgi:hypothetical protein
MGNGASIAFDRRFRYDSLLDEAIKMNLVSSSVMEIFDHLETKDFEYVLRMLWHSSKINEALNIRDAGTDRAYDEVRYALIETIRSIHVNYTDVRERLPLANNFMARFDTVVSLSYDVLAYWATLSQQLLGPNRFKDCFIGGRFEHDWGYLREPYQGQERATLIFYPHGNLALASDIWGNERKIAAEGVDLLTTVFAAWSDELTTPLFVSEGTSGQKLSAIRRSRYLTNVLEQVLPHLGESVAFLGWSMGDSDEHIFRAVFQGDARRFAVAVDASADDLDENMGRTWRRIRQARGRRDFELLFFDRSSSGLWINP